MQRDTQKEAVMKSLTCESTCDDKINTKYGVATPETLSQRHEKNSCAILSRSCGLGGRRRREMHVLLE